jgi:hypothetical protein
VKITMQQKPTAPASCAPLVPWSRGLPQCPPVLVRTY